MEIHTGFFVKDGVLSINPITAIVNAALFLVKKESWHNLKLDIETSAKRREQEYSMAGEDISEVQKLSDKMLIEIDGVISEYAAKIEAVKFLEKMKHAVNKKIEFYLDGNPDDSISLGFLLNEIMDQFDLSNIEAQSFISFVDSDF